MSVNVNSCDLGNFPEIFVNSFDICISVNMFMLSRGPISIAWRLIHLPLASQNHQHPCYWFTRYVGRGFPRGRTSTAYTILWLRSDRKIRHILSYEYTYIVSEKFSRLVVKFHAVLPQLSTNSTNMNKILKPESLCLRHYVQIPLPGACMTGVE